MVFILWNTCRRTIYIADGAYLCTFAAMDAKIFVYCKFFIIYKEFVKKRTKYSTFNPWTSSTIYLIEHFMLLNLCGKN